MKKEPIVLKAELINALYEQTIDGSLIWKEIGDTDYSFYNATDKSFLFHSWDTIVNGINFTLKKRLCGIGTENHLYIYFKDNDESGTTIKESEVEDIYIVNPIKALLGRLENQDKKEASTFNVSLTEMIRIIKDKRKRKN